MPKKLTPLADRDVRLMDDEWLSALTSSEKEPLLVRTLFELRTSHDRLNQSPRNSSKRPSTRAPWETAASADEPSSAKGLPDTAPVPAADEDSAEAHNAAPDGPFRDKVTLGQWRMIGPRPARVIARRISMGARSEAGTRAFAVLASAIETCRKRAASYWVFIASVIAAAKKRLAPITASNSRQGVNDYGLAGILCRRVYHFTLIATQPYF